MQTLFGLLNGFSDAAGGTAYLYERGSSTPVQYYEDAEGNVPVAANTPVDLDDRGRAVVYVDEMTRVIVYDSDGEEVVDYVEMYHAGSIEIRTPSFIGTHYDTAEEAVNYPTTLQEFVDQWITDNGAVFAKVLVNGTAQTIQSVLAQFLPIYFNVKSTAYGGGAVGDGVTDDTDAILAAITAANAATYGGTVFFPPGTYRVTQDITVPSKVSLKGLNPETTRLRTDGEQFLIAPSSYYNLTPKTIEGLAFDHVTSGSTDALIALTANGGILFRDCQINADAKSASNDGVVFVQSGPTFIYAVFQDCVLKASKGSTQSKGFNYNSVYTELHVYNSHLRLQSGTHAAGAMLEASRIEVVGTRFPISSGAVTVSGVYVAVIGTAFGCTVSGCRFQEPSSLTGSMYCLSLPDADASYVVAEGGNHYGDGDLPTQFLPYYTAGSKPGGYLQSRPTRFLEVSGDNDSSFTADFRNYGKITHIRTTTGDQTIEITPGPDGAKGTLTIDNTAGGGNIIFYWGTNVQGQHQWEQILDGDVRTFEFEFYLDSGTVKARQIFQDDGVEVGVLSIEETGLNAATVNHDFDITSIWAGQPAAGDIPFRVLAVAMSGSTEKSVVARTGVITTSGGVLTAVQGSGSSSLTPGVSTQAVNISINAGDLRVQYVSDGVNITEAQTRVELLREI